MSTKIMNNRPQLKMYILGPLLKLLIEFDLRKPSTHLLDLKEVVRHVLTVQSKHIPFYPSLVAFFPVHATNIHGFQLTN